MGNKNIQPTKETVHSMYSKASSVNTNISSNAVFSLIWHFRSIFKGLKKSLSHWASIATVSARIKKTLQKSSDGSFITTVCMEGTLSNICLFAQLVNEDSQARSVFLCVKDFTFRSDFWNPDKLIVIKREVSEWTENEEYNSQCDSSGKAPPDINSSTWEKTKPRKTFLILCSQWDFYQKDVVLDIYKPIEVVMLDLYLGTPTEILDDISTTTDQMRNEIVELKRIVNKLEFHIKLQDEKLASQDRKLDLLIVCI